jgi:hypothetical protein
MTSIAPIFALVSKNDSENKPSEDELVAANSKLRQQVTTLTAENAKLKTENAQLKKRKASDSTGAAASSSSAPATKKPKTPAQRTKLFEKWTKGAIRESGKHKIINGGYGGDTYTVTVKETTPWMVDEFQSMFAGQGVKIQPTASNKPTSQITILEFGTFSDIEKLFAECGGSASIARTGYKAQNWRQRSFSKSYHNGDSEAQLEKLQVHFNKSKMSLHLLFTLETADGDY